MDDNCLGAAFSWLSLERNCSKHRFNNWKCQREIRGYCTALWLTPTILVVRSVCKRWCRISYHNPIAWNKFHLYISENPSAEIVSKELSLVPRITCHQFPREFILPAFHSIFNLKYLQQLTIYLDDIDRKSSVIHVQRALWNDLGTLNKLEYFKLEFLDPNFNLGRKSLNKLFKQLQQLVGLKVLDLTLNENLQQKIPELSGLTNLVYLAFRCGLREDSKQYIDYSKFPNLKFLDLNGVVGEFKETDTITHIKLGDCVKSTTTWVCVSESQLIAITKFTQLLSLDLVDQMVTDRMLVSITANCKLLEILDISLELGEKTASTSGGINLVRTLPNLKTLLLSGLISVTDQFLALLSENEQSKLEYLSLSAPPANLNVSLTSIHSLIACLSRLNLSRVDAYSSSSNSIHDLHWNVGIYSNCSHHCIRCWSPTEKINGAFHLGNCCYKNPQI